jgi:hypothetical protein
MGIRTESNILNSVSQETPMRNKGKRKEQTVLESARKKKSQNYRNNQTTHNNNLKCKWS